jgi:hypothetical protein
MKELFLGDSLPTVAQFKSMYQGYENYTEIIDSIHLDSISLSPTSVVTFDAQYGFTLFPNPVATNNLHVAISDQFQSIEDFTFRIMTVDGKLFQSGTLTALINLDNKITTGLYYLAVYNQHKLISLQPFIRL